MEWCFISAGVSLVRIPIISLVTITYPLSTHSLTCIYAFAQLCRVHCAERDWFYIRVWVCLKCMSATLHACALLMDVYCSALLCPITQNILCKSVQALTALLNVFHGCFSTCANIKDSLLLKVDLWEHRRHWVSASLDFQGNCVDWVTGGRGGWE